MKKEDVTVKLIVISYHGSYLEAIQRANFNTGGVVS
jgi:hypothetical protein